MSDAIKETMTKIHQLADELIKKLHEGTELPEDDAHEIIDAMQAFEDKFANLLSEFGVEIGDERID